MTLRITTEGIYETDIGSGQKKFTNFNFTFDVARVKTVGVGTHVLRRFIPMLVDNNKKKYNNPLHNVKSYVITDIEKIDDKISIENKNIAEMNEWELQELATLFDLYEIPLAKSETITLIREKAILAYMRKVLNIKLDTNEDYAQWDCFKQLPTGEYKLDFDKVNIPVDCSLLKDENILDVKPTKKSLTDYVKSSVNAVREAVGLTSTPPDNNGGQRQTMLSKTTPAVALPTGDELLGK